MQKKPIANCDFILDYENSEFIILRKFAQYVEKTHYRASSVRIFFLNVQF